jgi:hypothetical protein
MPGMLRKKNGGKRMDSAKIIFAVLLCALMGCASLRVETPEWKMCARTFCKDIQIPKTSVVTPSANIQVEGYKGSVNLVALENITDKITQSILAAGMKAIIQ